VFEDGISEKAIWHVVKQRSSSVGLPQQLRTTCDEPAHGFAGAQAVNWIRFSFCSATCRFKRLSSTSGLGSASGRRSMIGWGLSRHRKVGSVQASQRRPLALIWPANRNSRAKLSR